MSNQMSDVNHRPHHHVVVVGVALSGHVNPTLPILRRLQQRNAIVTYYTSDTEHKSAIEKHGATHRVVSPLQQANQDQKGGSMLDIVVRGLNTLPWLLNDIESLSAPPTVLVYDHLALWGRWAGEVLGIPLICSSSTFIVDDFEMNNFQFSPTEDHLAALRSLKARYSVELKLENILASYAADTLVYTLESLQPSGDWASHKDRQFHFVGPMIDSDSTDYSSSPDDESFMADYDRLRSQFTRAVYVSMGTVVATSGKFWRQIERSFPATSDILVVCATGISPENDYVRPPMGENILARMRLPQKLLLERGRVDLFISHAGMNSIHEALWNGVPLLCIPHVGDQPFNASIIERSGCGKMIDCFDVTVMQLQELSNEILSNSHFKENTEKVKDELRNAGGPNLAATVILEISKHL